MRPRILVVDDDPDILDAICDILGAEGYPVARARHGLEALEQVARQRPDLILLDLMMPVMDGPTFARELRASYSGQGIPIIVISADGNPGRAVSVNARRYLAKPFDIEVLLSHVAEIARELDGAGAGAAAP
ncbi:MAG TPA: response regulator [Anaeromyxobacteraceae bacterium]|jgi:CheY-like chemotaxis protein|nr:response regulator [Anaeromyxobacteraceae bacterium]